jgi:hypothetical protein
VPPGAAERSGREPVGEAVQADSARDHRHWSASTAEVGCWCARKMHLEQQLPVGASVVGSVRQALSHGDVAGGSDKAAELRVGHRIGRPSREAAQANPGPAAPWVRAR